MIFTKKNSSKVDSTIPIEFPWQNKSGRHQESTKANLDVQLVKKLTGLISIKGEDILLNTASDHQHRYHRLRASIPSKLWPKNPKKWGGSTANIEILMSTSHVKFVKFKLTTQAAIAAAMGSFAAEFAELWCLCGHFSPS